MKSIEAAPEGELIQAASLPIQSLVIVEEPLRINLLQQLLRHFGFGIEVCRGGDSANEKIGRSKFDLIVVDCDGAACDATTFQAIRNSLSNRRSIVVALTDRNVAIGDLYRLGANFVVQKPLTSDLMTRTLRVAYGLAIQERRAYFRCPVDFPIILDLPGASYRCRAANVSQGGLSLELPNRVRVGHSVTLTFVLPEATEAIRARAEVVWSDVMGKTGVRFVELSSRAQNSLREWLARELDRRLALPCMKPIGLHAVASRALGRRATCVPALAG